MNNIVDIVQDEQFSRLLFTMNNTITTTIHANSYFCADLNSDLDLKKKKER